MNLYEYANYCDINCKFRWKDLTLDDGYRNTSPAGSFKPNGLGLYDMTGNVWEWCSDSFNSDYYKSSPENNPECSLSSNQRSIRGGSWVNSHAGVRAINRHGAMDLAGDDIGFRLVMVP